MDNLWIFVYAFFYLMASLVSANVLVISNNTTLSFEDIEANFSPSVNSSGICGVLYTAEPSNACKELSNVVEATDNVCKSPFVLIVRGGCTFEDKVRRAQAAGFKAAIIHDNEYGDLIAMAGNSAGIRIPSIFVSKASGEILSKYALATEVEVWLIPGFESSAWSIMAISFISLLAMSAVLATCFFVRRHRVRRERPRTSRVREFHGMSSRLVKAMPSLVFTAVLEDNCTSSTCAICLEDYNFGEKLRILPCRHKFHAPCVDAWLTSWRTFCPVCKRDARTANGDQPASESTPLLSSSLASISSAALSSFRSSISSASALQIAPASSRSPVSRPLSISSTGHNQPQSFHSYYHQSPHLSISRSSADLLRRASSLRSHTPHLASPRSIGYPSVSPHNSRYMSSYVPSPGNGSSSYHNSRYMSSYVQSPGNASSSYHNSRYMSSYVASPGNASSSYHNSRYMSGYVPSPGNASSSYYIGGSSSQQQNALHCSESTPSFSPFTSAQSLPEC